MNLESCWKFGNKMFEIKMFRKTKIKFKNNSIEIVCRRIKIGKKYKINLIAQQCFWTLYRDRE